MTNHLEYFLNHDFDSYEECLDFYLTNMCNNLLKTSPQAIIDVKNKLYNGISKYAENYSEIYAKQYQFYTRNEFKDIDAWLPKVKKGGIISGHDYGNGNPSGVKMAVDEKFANFQLNGSCWYVDL